MIKLITDEKLRDEWNNVVEHPLQSWEWGEVRQKTGTRVLRIGIVDNKERLVHGFLVTLHPIPMGRIMAYIPRGMWPDSGVISFIKQQCPSCVALKIEANLWIEQAGDYQIPLLKKEWEQNGFHFVISKSRIIAGHTFVVDVTPPENELLSRMKSKTRYNIRLAQKKGVTVRDEMESEKGFDIFFDLYKQTMKRQNYLGHGRDYHETVWRTLEKAGMVKNLVAYYEGKPLAAYQIFFFKQVAYYIYGGTSVMHKDVMASNLLMWEALQLARKHGCMTFDMWGALPSGYNPKDPWAGFHRFKEGYGGEHKTLMPTIDVVFDNAYYSLFSFLWPLRTRVLEILSKIRH